MSLQKFCPWHNVISSSNMIDPVTSNSLRVEKILPYPKNLAKAVVNRAIQLRLVFEERNKSRFAAQLTDGRSAIFFLPRGNILADGDILVADDGTMICVRAENQAVITISSSDPHKLLQAGYHLGNRHIPVQIGSHFLRIEPDSVLEGMLTQLGLEMVSELAPFEPESGAYGGGHRHSHAETFDSDYELAQKVYAQHEPHSHSPQHGHDHSHCSHDHNHDH